MARSFQVPVTFEDMSVADNVMVGAFLRTRTARCDATARAVLAFTGLAPLADTPARSLGTPGRKRLEIARALATEPGAAAGRGVGGADAGGDATGDRTGARHHRAASPS